jgi:hypothetical protein
MFFVPAVKTRETMLDALTTLVTARAVLRRVTRTDFGLGNAEEFRLAGTSLADQPPLPQRQPAAQCFASDLAFLRLGNVQFLPNKNATGFDPD